MIDKFYKEFSIRDYIENEGMILDKTYKIIDCSLGTNPFLDEEFIRRHMKQASCIINEYPINEYDKLKDTLIKFWKENSDVNRLYGNNISFGSGTMGIMRNLCQFIIKENSFVLGYSPQFPRFISEFELKKAVYEYYSLDERNNYQFIAKDFIDKINSKYEMLYIDNPNNPTGQIISVKDIEEIVKKAKKFNIIVVVDEAYGEYMSLNNSAITLVNKYDNIIILRSASKFFGLPNHRIGYLIADKEFIKVYDKIAMPFPFSDLSCNIFINILQDYNKIKDIKKIVIDANKKIFNNIDKNNYLHTNIETPIFTLKSDKYENLTNELLKKGIITETASNFINLDNRYARIRIPKDYENLIKILKQVL